MTYIMTDDEATEAYNAFLDEVYGEVSVAGMLYSTSQTLLEIDPTAYRCGFADWLDSEEIVID